MDLNQEERKDILAAKAGDTAAFGRLYAKYAPGVFRFVSFRIPVRENAEDITSNVFLRAWEAMRTFDPEKASFRGWLLTIARRQTIDQYRKKLNRDISLDESLPDVTEPLPDRIQAQEEGNAVLEALKTLSPAYAEILSLRFFGELETKEMAEVLGKSEGAVRILQHRALKELRTVLQKSSAHFMTSDTPKQEV